MHDQKTDEHAYPTPHPAQGPVAVSEPETAQSGESDESRFASEIAAQGVVKDHVRQAPGGADDTINQESPKTQTIPNELTAMFATAIAANDNANPTLGWLPDDAWARLLELLRKLVRRQFPRYPWLVNEADDIVQEVLWSFRGANWIGKTEKDARRALPVILKRRIADHVDRTQQERERLGPNDTLEGVPDPDPSTTAENIALREHLTRVLTEAANERPGSLFARVAELYLDSLFNETDALSAEEMAALLGCSVSRVQQIRRGLAELLGKKAA